MVKAGAKPKLPPDVARYVVIQEQNDGRIVIRGIDLGGVPLGAVSALGLFEAAKLSTELMMVAEGRKQPSKPTEESK